MPDQKEAAAAAGNLWRKKLVLHGMRVDDLVGYSENPMASPPPEEKIGFVSASFARCTVAGEAGPGRPVVSSTSEVRCAGPASGMRPGLLLSCTVVVAICVG